MLAPSALAQKSSVVVPQRYASVEGSSRSTYPLSYRQVRWQMLVDSSEICSQSATLLSLEFRADGLDSIDGYAAFQLRPTIDLYVTSTSASTMSNTWAANIGSAAKQTVFSGKTLDLPAFTGGRQVPQDFVLKVPFAKPFVLVRSQGNLLIDWLESQAYVRSSWLADAAIYWKTARPANTKIWESSSCQDAAGNQASISIASSGGSPGQTLDVNFTLSPGQGQNLDLFVNWLGFSNQQYGALKLPFDVTGFAGMSNCSLATDIVMLQAATKSPVSWAIPSDPRLEGLALYTQGMAIDTKAMSLVLTDDAYIAEIQPAGGYAKAPVQSMFGFKYTGATTGSMSSAFYAPILRLNGVIN